MLKKPRIAFRSGLGWLAVTAIAALGAGLAFLVLGTAHPAIDPSDKDAVARGQRIYASHCAACHGSHLEGQPNWRERNSQGRLPAPPHDASGHTWHHADAVLFGIVKQGLVPGKYAPPGYQSDMPAFGGTLSDADVGAVLAYIKSTWPEHIRAKQSQIDRWQRTR